MADVTLDGENGRTLLLRRLSGIDENAMWEFEAVLQLPDATARRKVYEHGSALRTFLGDLAAAWRGFDGVRTYTSLEGDLTLSATHDGRGTVNCIVRLRQPVPPQWSMETLLEFGGGAHLEGLAREVAAFVP